MQRKIPELFLQELTDGATDEKKKKVYHYLNAFGLTPWIALHLIYVVIISLFAWLNNNGFSDDRVDIIKGWLISMYHIEKNTVQETLVIPLYGRKVCSEHQLFS